ncbi:MAG: hypothetical protein AB7N76_15210 [Planctomycetota bacterium]
MKTRILAGTTLGAALVVVALTQAFGADDAVKELKKQAGQLAGIKGDVAADDARLTKTRELIEQVAKTGGAEGAKLLLALTAAPFQSPAVEVTVAEMAKDGLRAMEDEKARAAVYAALTKSKKKAQLAVPLIEIVAGWQTLKAAQTLGELLAGSKDERIVMAAARGLGQIPLKESLKPLIDAYPEWQKRGGEPIEVIGRALYDLTLQPLTKAEDWEKWFKDTGKDWTPEMRAQAKSEGGTKQRPNHFQSDAKVPKFFETLEVPSHHLVIVMDVSGSMHIRQYIEEPGEGESAGKGTSLGKPDLPAGDPRKEGYKPKKCTFNQCPAARGRAGATCPSDENLPVYYSRMARLSRAVQRLVRGLPDRTHFNMVAYSTNTRTWKGKALIAATPANKEKAVEWLAGLQPDGVTRSDEAVKEAFSFGEADTVIFVTDGAPTDATGKPLDDTRVKEFLAEVQKMNRARKVKIDVIAISEGHTDFASGLAEQNRGKYVTVD